MTNIGTTPSSVLTKLLADGKSKRSPSRSNGAAEWDSCARPGNRLCPAAAAVGAHRVTQYGLDAQGRRETRPAVRQAGEGAHGESRELRRDGQAYLAWYRRADSSDVVAAWTEEGSQRVSLSGELETAVDMMGVAQPVSDSIELTENPVYLIGRELKISSG